MKLPRLGVILALLVLAIVPVAGQTASADPVSEQLADDLAGIRSALDRLVVLHEAGRRQRDVDLVLKRIEMRERRLEPLESRLQSAEVDVRKLGENLEMLEKMDEQHENRLQEEIKEGVDTPGSETRRMLEDIERSREAVVERIEAAELRQRRLEDEIAEQQEEIEVLDDKLAELLEGS